MRKFCFFTVLIFSVLLIGCSDFENYSASPSHKLYFSTDTLSFDTVFTTIGSTTGYFMVYNNNSENLKIDRIFLSNGTNNGFRINVDGRKGESFEDLIIWKKDSLYIAVEVTVDPNDMNSPFEISDSIVFITNGNVQKVLLQAYGQNAHIIRGGYSFDRDSTLTADKPYLIYDSIYIPENVTLNIDKGGKFYMHRNAKWVIDGTIKSNGTLNEPVIFRGDRLNNFLAVLSFDRFPSQWDGMYFGASSYDNTLDYTWIRNGISGLTFEESTVERKKMTINNSKIANMYSDVLFAVNCHIEAYNSEFNNAGGYLVLLAGGKYQFTHCTVANYMSRSLSGNSSRFYEALTLSDNITDVTDNKSETKSLPLQQAFFDNCIIDGNSTLDTTKRYSGEICLITDSSKINGNAETFNYRFNHCFIKTVKVSNDRFIKSLFVDSPDYVKLGKKNKDTKEYDYIYDFHLSEGSAGVGSADPGIAAQYPVDRDGVNRLTSESGPSIGAYEYVPVAEEKNE